MDRPTCKTCPYWHEYDHNPGHGECRRHAPNPVLRGVDLDENPGSADVNTVWANANRDDWCGEHPDFPVYVASLNRNSP